MAAARRALSPAQPVNNGGRARTPQLTVARAIFALAPVQLVLRSQRVGNIHTHLTTRHTSVFTHTDRSGELRRTQSTVESYIIVERARESEETSYII